MALSERMAKIIANNARTKGEEADLAEFLEYCSADEWEEYLVLSGQARQIEIDSASKAEI